MPNADQLRAEIASVTDLLKKGRADRAFKRATKAAKKWPKMAAFPRLAGLCAVQQQKPKLAQTYFERAWRMDPANPELIQNYGLSLVQGGESEAALRFIARIAARGPLTPAQRFIHAMALLREHQGAQALTEIDEVIRHQPTNLEAHCLKADILDEQHRWNDAIDVLVALVETHPKFHFGQLRLAKSLVGVGRLDEALTHARMAFELAPTHPETLELITTLPDVTPDDLSRLEAQIAVALNQQPTANPQDDAMVHFAAAALARRGKDLAAELQHLDHAHRLLREGFQGWEDRSAQAFHQRLAAPLPLAASGSRPAVPRPIFVVGLPRSGTTLVERILSAHSSVQGLGELASVDHWARKSDASELQQAGNLAEFYIEHLPDLRPDATAFVDKAPGNYAYVGAIAQAFPNALILNITRDPRDIALSMWRAHFGAGGLYFSHDFKWMAAEANRYRRYMDHWDHLLPGRIQTVSYETLVGDFKPSVSGLATLCDLTFEEAMLSPQSATDAVRTASGLQIRQAVTTSSVGRWKTVEDHLAPFIRALDAELWPELGV
ncbi:putative TPR/sulfotransferase domain protein [Rhodobacteraceae bacterium KLH11]|nr:putative TPR/sulfotransferase domain protein [Rhodobacteraceae bacterium KLH11]